MYVAIAVMWTGGIGAAYVLFVLLGPQDPDKKCASFLDRIPPIYFTLFYVIYFCLILFTLLVSYASVWRVTKTHVTRVSTSPAVSWATTQESVDHGIQTLQTPQQNTGSRKAPKFIITAIGAYLLTWTMNLCVRVAETAQPELSTWEPWIAIEFISLLVGFSNLAVNIFIYSCYLSDFRKAYRRILLCCCVERQ